MQSAPPQQTSQPNEGCPKGAKLQNQKIFIDKSLGQRLVDHKGIADLLEHKLVTLVPHLVDQDRVVVGVIVQALVLFAVKELSLYCGDVIQEIYKMF